MIVQASETGLLPLCRFRTQNQTKRDIRRNPKIPRAAPTAIGILTGLRGDGGGVGPGVVPVVVGLGSDEDDPGVPSAGSRTV